MSFRRSFRFRFEEERVRRAVSGPMLTLLSFY